MTFPFPREKRCTFIGNYVEVFYGHEPDAELK